LPERDQALKREDLLNQNNAKRRKSGGILTGVVLLTVSNLLVKVTGLLFKIPMNHIVGDTGMGYYNSAYSIYTLFYMLSTSGLPVALSVMVSARRAGGKIVAAKRAYRMAMVLFFVMGLGVCCLMLFGAGFLSDLIRSERSALSVVVAAPTILFVCVSAALRGYFQGCGNMAPTAVSQLLEAVGKLVFGIGAAYYAVRRGYEIHVVSAFAVSGLTIGSFLGMLWLLVARFLRGDRDLLIEDTIIDYEKPTRRRIFSELITIALPVTISASVMSLTSTIDTAMIQRILSETMSAEAAATVYGNYTSLAVPMFNLPPVLVYPIAYALLPALTAAHGSGQKEKVNAGIETALRYAVIIALPCALGLSVLADPILCLLYKDSSAHAAAGLLTLLAPSSFFVCILAITNAVLQALGKERLPVISMLCGAIVKCTSGAVLLHWKGISGAPISTFLCYLTVTVLNFIFVIRVSGIRLSFIRVFGRPLAAGLLCAWTALFVYQRTGLCLVAIGAAALIYGSVLFWMGTITKDEIRCLLRLDRMAKRKDDSHERRHAGFKMQAQKRRKA